MKYVHLNDSWVKKIYKVRYLFKTHTITSIKLKFTVGMNVALIAGFNVQHINNVSHSSIISSVDSSAY